VPARQPNTRSAIHSQLHIAAQEHVADLHRAADHNRLVRAATITSHAVPATRRADAPVPFLRWLRRRQA
jgi:hypothetical protein